MAIQQHPLPQDISSYRFRLIGDMTIKQFASLGISIVVSIIVYSLPLPFFFKYPLSFLFLVLGIGMAFVPVQGRSLDVWILAFIKSIYSPTQYVWKKSTDITPEMSLPSGPSIGTQAVSNARIEISTQTTTPPVSETPNATPSTPSDITSQTPNPIPDTKSENISTAAKLNIEISPPTPHLTPAPITPPQPTEEIRPEVQQKIISVPQEVPQPVPNETQLPIPFTPTSPNTLVGLTLTPEGKILDGVLVEIQNNGLTSRATKSNKLGQFMFARPLENGLYQIISEKPDYSFPPYSLELTGEIVKPLKIQAH